MAELHEAESRMAARRTLRNAYNLDVDMLAQEITARVRRGDFDESFPYLDHALGIVIRHHPRVRDLSLSLETIGYSENRNSIETDYMRGWSEELDGPWTGFQLAVDPELGGPCDITLPAWSAIAYHALFRDVRRRVYELLGDTPEQYIATRLGVDWNEDR
jgi:hypothetical protein